MTESFEVVTHFAPARIRVEPWFTKVGGNDILGFEHRVEDLMMSSAEVCIIASLAAHNNKTLTVGFLLREYDEGRGDMMTKARAITGGAVYFCDEHALGVVEPATGITWSIGTTAIYDLHIEVE